MKNKLASMVYYGTLEVSMTSGDLHKAYATTLFLPACILLWNHVPKKIVTLSYFP
jgi:hypothetical protein